MVAVCPTRAAPLGLAEIVTVTGLLPVPDAGNNGVRVADVADHVHLGSDAATLTTAVPPADVVLMVDGEIVNEQLAWVNVGAGGANCVMLNVCPATVIVGVRCGWPEGLAAM